MSRGVISAICILAVVVFATMGSVASAERGGWADPGGGWDLVYEGSILPLDDGWYNTGGSDDPGGYNADDVTLQTITGQGETEDGINPAANALVLRIQDNSTGTDGTGRKIKFTKPFEGTYTGTQDQHLINVEGGVTICVRWRVVAGTVMEPDRSPYTYGHYVLGIDGGAVPEGRCGIAIGEGHTQWSAGDNVRSTATAVGDLTQFQSMWIIMERANESSDPPNNFKGTLYLNGSVTPADAAMWGPGAIGGDAIWGTGDDDPAALWYDGNDASADGAGEPEENRAVACVGPGRTGATITIEYDYILMKKGIHLPVAAGPPTAPSGLSAALVGGGVRLTWTDNSNNEEGFIIERSTDDNLHYGEIARTAAGTVVYNDANVVSDTTYYYRVRAYRGADVSDPSNEVNITTPTGSLGARGWHLYDR